jgi:hypothetical protein
VQHFYGIFYKLVFIHSNKCLSFFAPHTRSPEGAAIGQEHCHTGDEQLWSGTFRDGVFEIHSNWWAFARYGLNMCIDVPWASTANGSPVVLSGCHGGISQQWYFLANNQQLPPTPTPTATPSANAQRNIAELRFAGNIHSCLEVRGGEGATWNGATTGIWNCWGGTNQKVSVEDAGDGYYYLRFQHSSKCLEVPGWNPAWGVRLGQWSCHGGDNQKWSGTFDDGQFSIQWNKYLWDAHRTRMCIDVEGGSPADGTAVRSWGCDQEAQAQRWYFLPNGLETTLETPGSELRFGGNINKCLKIPAESDGAFTYYRNCPGESNPKIRVEDAGDGYYYIVLLHSDKCLTAVGRPSLAVSQFACNGGDEQKWSGPFRDDGAPAIHWSKYWLDTHGTYRCLHGQMLGRDDGGPVFFEPCDGGAAQQWYFLASELPFPPTSTPTATATTHPTNTPSPTGTPTPPPADTLTPTAPPANTPTQTNTPVSEAPTNTPIPQATPAP